MKFPLPRVVRLTAIAAGVVKRFAAPSKAGLALRRRDTLRTTRLLTGAWLADQQQARGRPDGRQRCAVDTRENRTAGARNRNPPQIAKPEAIGPRISKLRVMQIEAMLRQIRCELRVISAAMRLQQFCSGLGDVDPSDRHFVR